MLTFYFYFKNNYLSQICSKKSVSFVPFITVLCSFTNKVSINSNRLYYFYKKKMANVFSVFFCKKYYKKMVNVLKFKNLLIFFSFKEGMANVLKFKNLRVFLGLLWLSNYCKGALEKCNGVHFKYKVYFLLNRTNKNLLKKNVALNKIYYRNIIATKKINLTIKTNFPNRITIETKKTWFVWKLTLNI